jgi:hypothetical protein
MFGRECFLFVLLVPCLAVGGAGCDRSNSTAAAVAQVRPLEDVGDMYRMYTIDQRKPPTKAGDFRPFQDSNPEGYRAVKGGSVAVVWGVKLTDLAMEGSRDSPDEVLAYEAKVPAEGGLVLMKNRTVKTFTPEQFKAAPRAAGN